MPQIGQCYIHRSGGGNLVQPVIVGIGENSVVWVILGVQKTRVYVPFLGAVNRHVQDAAVAGQHNLRIHLTNIRVVL